MDVQLKELIDRIKSEGIENAEQQARTIIDEAESRAKKIINDAEKEADTLRQKAEADVRKAEYTGRESLKQAGRDLVIMLRQRLQELFARVIYTETAAQLKGSQLQKIIGELVNRWDEDIQNLELLISEEELKGLEKGLRDKLSEQLAKGMEIKPLANVDAGFKVSYKDGSAYYNFSAEGIAEIISGFLNPKLAEILKEAVEEQE